MNTTESSKGIGGFARYALLVSIAVVFLVPFYLILRNSLMTDAQITSFHW